MLIMQPGRQGGLCEQLSEWEGDQGPDDHSAVSCGQDILTALQTFCDVSGSDKRVADFEVHQWPINKLISKFCMFETENK